jgi:hypothetical protein
MSHLAATDIALTPFSGSRTTEQVLECEGIECLQDLAQSAKVDLVIQVRVRAKQPTKKVSRRARPDYLVSMVVVRAAPDREAWSEKADCQACEASEIGHTASLLASMIAERIKIKKDLPAPTHEARPAPTTMTTAQAAPPPAPATSPRRAAPASESEWSVPRYVSVPTLAGGVLLIGSGLYLIHIDGEGTCDLTAPKDLCPRRYETRNAGIGLVAGGGLAALGGLAGWIFFSPSAGSTPMALSLTGSSISVSGRF